MDRGENNRVKVITIAVGGATCSGKTTLAKHLRSCLSNSVIIHQDPQELVPFHPEYNVQDWDDAPGAIQWPSLAAFLQEVKRTGVIPQSHKSHDHLNENKLVPVEDDVIKRWRKQSEQLSREHLEKYGEKIVWAIVDGFLMYWDQAVIDQLDIRILLRTPHDVLKKRRHERHGYHTAVQTDPEGALWRDPPNYWEQIVYPAYVRAHRHLFEGGNVEDGKLNDKVPGILLFDGSQVSMQEMLDKAMEKVIRTSNEV
ncbi:P-loop containing nucleoside triphosphate hydrolase protein [Hysterangium stoloniferum]|nr:P-loop containing nucleoside triphosphate hydrolase protein [Hysterangium stoloniferum]